MMLLYCRSLMKQFTTTDQISTTTDQIAPMQPFGSKLKIEFFHFNLTNLDRQYSTVELFMCSYFKIFNFAMTFVIFA